MEDERFSIWLSMAARDRPLRSRIRPELGRAGFLRKVGSRFGFTGERIGRGAGVGRVLAVNRANTAHPRKVAADTRVVRLRRNGQSFAVKDHLRYLVRAREAVDRRLTLYGPQLEPPSSTAFVGSCRNDRHQFRTVLQAQDACEYEDLRPLVRRLMSQVAHDLRTSLDWVAVDHYDTATPHSHIVIRGVDDGGKDLIIAREYLYYGLSQRASALVALDLGPELAGENDRAKLLQVEISSERPTGIDRDLLDSMDGHGRVSHNHVDRWRQAERAGRLRTLESLGLAHSDGHGLWYLQPDLIERLGEIEWRNRITRAPSLSAAEIKRGEVDRFDAHLKQGGANIGTERPSTEQDEERGGYDLDHHFASFWVESDGGSRAASHVPGRGLQRPEKSISISTDLSLEPNDRREITQSLPLENLDNLSL